MPSRPTIFITCGTIFLIFFGLPAADLHGKGDILEKVFLRQQLEILENNADLTPEYRDLPLSDAGYIPAADHDLALVDPLLADQRLDQRGLAGSGLADDRHELARLDMEIDLVQSPDILRIYFTDVIIADHMLFYNNIIRNRYA